MKKLHECTEHYFYRIFHTATGKVVDEGTAPITKRVDNGDSVYVEFEGPNSWTLDKASTGSSISIGTGELKCFLGSTPEALEKGIQDYADGIYVEIRG